MWLLLFLGTSPRTSRADNTYLLADELVPDGITIVELSFDHFYRDPEINLKSMAIASLVADELNAGSTLRKLAE
jgi:hypothetical protein